MNSFLNPANVRWSDLDPNGHVRHSVYYDWGAYTRIRFFEENQLTIAVLQSLQIGPILFREECIFRKEIHMGDKLELSFELVRSRRDYSRWSIRHHIFKNGDTVAAIINVDGAWLDLSKRKLATPPEKIFAVFENGPKAEDFSWIE